MDETDQIDAEPKGDEVKLLPRVSNGSDSGHPSSRNFSVASGLSDSLSTEDSSAQETSAVTSIHDSTMEGHKKEENKTFDGEVFGAKVEETVTWRVGYENENVKKEDLDTVEETLVSEKRNAVEVGEHSEGGTDGIVSQVIKDTEDEGKRRKSDVLEKAEETNQKVKSGSLVSVSKGGKVGGQIKSSDTGYSPEGLKTTQSETLSASDSIKKDKSEKIQASKAEPPKCQTDLRPNPNEASTVEAESPNRVQEKGQAEAVRKKVTMPSAPVVKEIVVPVVFEAFSMREMSKETPATDSDDSPSAIEMEEIPMARLVGVKEGSEVLPPETSTLYAQYDLHATATQKDSATSPAPSAGSAYSVHGLFINTHVSSTA